MSISIQTNVTSLFGQENLNTNSLFQSQTIEQLTSGYRINSSGDDAAGLAVANGLRSNIAELTQGVRNANDGVSNLQIIDGGLNNISQILDRLKTLATESASATFSGDRNTLNNEFQSDLAEITRQANNIGLGTGAVGGRFNTTLGVYIGGSDGVVSNAQIQVNLSGVSNRVDSTSLGLASSSVAAGSGSNDIGGAAVDLRTGTFLANSSQVFTVQLAGSTFTATVGNGGAAITGQQAVNQLNAQIAPLGITAAIDQNTGQLSFTGGVAFNVKAGAVTGGGSAVATATGTAQNSANYISSGAASYVAPATTTEVLSFTVNGNTTNVTLATGTSQAVAVNQLNAALNSQGIYAVNNTAGTGIDFQSAQAFTVSTVGTAAEGVYGATGTEAVTAPTPGQSVTGNALAAIAAIQQAVANLGLVQGKVGTGENQLSFAISLANSQITNFSAAESHIRDADVAAAAANLTKAQTLQQTSIAALAQANAAPAAVLKLLQ